MAPRKKMNAADAIRAIDAAGALLVFPISNKPEPKSLWSHFFPRSPMEWEWDEDGDDRVSDLWHLRAALSTTRKVVYTKWFQGRATYFSREIFTALLRAMNPDTSVELRLSPLAKQLLEILDGESPLSTKELKRMAGLKGRDNEASFQRAMKELWSRLLIVAFGEVDDGAFPSLAVGSTRVLFEDLWRKAFAMEQADALRAVARTLDPRGPFARFFGRLRKGIVLEAVPAKAESLRREAPTTRRGRAVGGVVSFEDLVG
jgi:hypothetical protein